MADPESLRERYVAIEPVLQDLKSWLEGWLDDAVRELNLDDARVAGRVKGVHSFLNKCLLRETGGNPWNDPLADVSDKIGVRVDVVYIDQVDSLVDYIESAEDTFSSIDVDDKTDGLGDRELGYRGVHIDVTPRNTPNGIDAEQCKCEIQVRTNAQSAWAMAVHPLQYKSPIDLPDEMHRPLFRLTALLELFDEGVRRARDHMIGSEGYPLAILERTLEESRHRFTALRHQRDLTRQIIVDLGVANVDSEAARALAGKINSFVDSNEAKLETVYSQHLDSAKPQLLVQPEAILIFYLLDTDRFDLAERWETLEIPLKYLEGLADVWGVSLPSPT